MISCVPTSVCDSGAGDLDEKSAIETMKARCDAFQEKELNPTSQECALPHLRYFLRQNKFNVDNAIYQWQEWVKWRHSTFTFLVNLPL